MAISPTEAPQFDSYDTVRSRALAPQPILGASVGVPAAPDDGSPSYLKDLALAPIRGAFQGAYEIVDMLTLDALPDEHYLGRSKTMPGQIVEGISQFLIGFVPVAGWLGRAGTLAKLGKAGTYLKGSAVARGAVAGAITDFSVFDGHEARLSNLIQSVPALQNPITDYLQSDADDSELEGRFKNAIEGIGIGAAVEGIFRGVRAIKEARSAKADGATPDALEDIITRNVGPDDVDGALKDFEGDAGNPSSDTPPTDTLGGKPVGEGGDSGLKSEPVVEAPVTKKASDFYRDPKAVDEAVKRAVSGDVNLLADGFTSDPKLFNLETINDSEDVIRFIAANTDVAREALKQAPMPDAVTVNNAIKFVADMVGSNEKTLARQLARDATEGQEQAARIIGYRLSLNSVSQNLFDLAKKVQSGSAADTQAFKETYDLFIEMMVNVRNMGRNSGRSLRAFRRMPIDHRQFDDLLEVALEQGGGRQTIAETATKFKFAFEASGEAGAAKLARADLSFGKRIMDVGNEYWINAILSGPVTHAVNAISNTFATLYRPLEGAVGALMKRDPATAKDFMRTYGYLFESIQDSASFAFKAIREGESILDPAAKTLDTGFQKTITAQNLGVTNETLGAAVDHLGNIVRLPTRFLTGSDEFFKQINARAAAKTKFYTEAIGNPKFGGDPLKIGQHVHDEFTKLIDESGRLYSKAGVVRQAAKEADEKGLQGFVKADFIQKYVGENFDKNRSLLGEYAKDYAKQTTFTNPLHKDELSYLVQQMATKHPALRMVIPFVRTPVNLIKFVGNRTPLPFLLKSSRDRLMAELTSPDKLVRSAAMGRMGMGALMFTTAGLAAMNGVITGAGPNNEAERKQLEATGWRPYSVKVGDEFVSYQRLDPFATFMGVMADMADLAKRADERDDNTFESMAGAVTIALAKNITNKSYLTGISQVVEAISDPDRFMTSLLRKQAGSYVPNVLASAVTTLGPDDDMKDVRSIFDAVAKRIPGASGFVEPQRNLLGETIAAPRSKMIDYVSPIVTSSKKNDVVFNEVAKLGYGFSQPRPIIAGNVDMTQFENLKGQSSYDRWLELTGEVRVQGKTLRQALEKLIKDPAYQGLSDRTTVEFDSPRVSAIRRVISKHRQAAFDKVLQEFPELGDNYETVTRNKVALKRGVSVADLLPLPNPR